jgi:hypothetical protein
MIRENPAALEPHIKRIYQPLIEAEGSGERKFEPTWKH